MNIFNQELINKSITFLKNIKKSDRVAVIHHTDPDGISSGVLMCKLIERLRGKQPDLRHNQPGIIHGFTDETLELLKSDKINKVITTDISPDENYENWKDVEEFAEILIVDHHPLIYEETDRTIILKPQLFQKDILPVRYCAAKLVYDLASYLVDMSDLDWIASIGIIGDVASPAWEDFLDKTFKKYNFVKGKDWFDSILGKTASTMSCAECYDESLIPKVFGILYRAKTPEEIINSELKQFKEIIQEEIQYWIKNLNEKAEFYPEIETIYYKITPKHHVKSSISTNLGIKFPNKTIFIVSEENDLMLISARRGDFKKSVNDILKKAIINIPDAQAGGHIPAAGARVPKQYYEVFKKRLLEVLHE
ncbi:hypothetical protein COV11_00565 [Candidatus Woesearchaeota archaeon CG10_big_fil_rev_8_21_14_0_10_30_7]|nr:MAG: hypothetical protein COV11_00565 [Candidatus Woesearchaeota archaeon CG10_big_fil_rev_8_21_14_0_10_30_7]